MPKTRISPRPERDKKLRASAGAYKKLREEVAKDFEPLQREAMKRWLEWEKSLDAIPNKDAK